MTKTKISRTRIASHKDMVSKVPKKRINWLKNWNPSKWRLQYKEVKKTRR